MSYNITKFQNNDPLNQDTLNRPLQQIESALNNIDSTVSNFVQTSSLVTANLPCTSNVRVGDFVYFNKGVLEPAIALWSNQYDNQGELLPAESAFPVGVCINKVTGTVANIATKGIVTDQTVINAIFGDATNNTFVIGDYYLSGTDAGKISLERAYMPVRVCTLVNTNLLSINIDPPPTNYHTHKYLILAKGWTSVDTATLDEDVPTGFEDGFVYNINADQDLQDIMYNWSGDYVIVNDGIIVIDGSFSITPNNVWAKVAPTGTVALFTTVPCAHDEPVVRAIKVLSKRVTASNDRGIVTIDIDNYIDEGTSNNASTAITNLTEDGTIIRTPIVSEIRTDDTLSSISGGNGIVYLSTAGVSRTLYPEVINLNNATTTVIANKLMYVFPAGRETSVMGVFHLNSQADGLQYKVYPFIEPIGASGTFSANFDVAVTFVKQGTQEGITSYEAGPMNQILSGTIAAETKYFIQGSTALTVDGAGTAYINITTNPATSNLLLGFGIVVEVEEK